jgi:hypothetical protein
MRLAVALDIPVGGLFYRFLGYLEVKLNNGREWGNEQ